MKRKQKNAILHDLQKKMVLLAGPRQAGKTTLSKEIAKKFKSSIYLSYDHSEDRKIILEEGWLPSTELVILDEIHKMEQWKNYLKGVYDTKPEHQKILVTGSARLEIFNQVGDSLAGRFFLHRLFPLSPVECDFAQIPYSVDHFMERGGFPEPFLTRHSIDAKRWRQQYIDSLLHTDVLDYENIRSVRNIRLVFELLRKKVGSPVSYESIARDIEVSSTTVKKYIQILEALYVVFVVPPYSNNIARSLLKEPKIYFFDNGFVKGDHGATFENFVANCLLKHVHAKIDYLGEPYSLRYLRTKEKKEVDFAIINEDEIEQMIEVKSTDHHISPHLKYFHEKYNIPAIQIVKELKRERKEGKIEVHDGLKFLKTLEL